MKQKVYTRAAPGRFSKIGGKLQAKGMQKNPSSSELLTRKDHRAGGSTSLQSHSPRMESFARRRHRRLRTAWHRRDLPTLKCRTPRANHSKTAMRPIEKKIVTDEQGQPVAVQIDYADWLAIERQLREETPAPEEDVSMSELPFDQLLESTQGIWTQGDGLEYQRRIRAEWDRPWETNE